MTAKAQSYATALDAARQEGRWHNDASARSSGPANALPWIELVRKFKKHNPNDILTSASAELEFKTHTLLQAAARDSNLQTNLLSELDVPLRSFPRANGSASQSNGNDRHLSFAPLITSAGAKEDLNSSKKPLEQAYNAQKDASASAHPAVASASIVLGFADYALGQFDSAGALLSSANQYTSELPSGHTGDLVLSSYVLQGDICERQQEHEKALSLYDKAVELFSRSKGPSPETLRWAERASYRRTMLSTSLRPGSASQFHQSYIPSKDLPFRHAVVLRSRLYQLVDSDALSSSPEVVELEERYESLLRRITSFPKAGQVNKHMLDFVDSIFFIWKRSNSPAMLEKLSQHEVNEPDTLRVIGIMERALSYTFQSHRLLRHLLALHAALSNKKAALKAFDLYTKLWEKAKETDLVAVARKLRRFQEEDAQKEQAQKSGSSNGQITSLESHLSPEEEADVDGLENYVETCCMAARVMCLEPREEDDAKRAAQRSERALEVLQGQACETHLKPRVQMWCGVAKSCQAFDEADPDTRPSLLAAALAHLQDSVRLNSNSFEAHYYLGLAQAEQCLTDEAIETIQKALHINSARNEAWNLLVLLISAQTLRKGEALQAATIALEGASATSDGQVESTPALDGLDLAAAGENVTENTTFSALKAIIQLRITKIVLVEALEGPQTALAQFKTLYATFAQDFAPFLQGETVTRSESAAGPSAAPNSSQASKGASQRHNHPHLHAAMDTLKVPSRRFSLRKTSTAKSGASSVASAPGSTRGSFEQPASASRPPSVVDGNEDLAPASPRRAGPPASSSLFAHRQKEARALEQTLWLSTAATFRRLNDMEQAREAIYEAEKIDPHTPDVWVQLGLLYAQEGNTEVAIECMDKGLAFSLDHVPALVHLSRLLMSRREAHPASLDMAEGYVDECSQLRGYNTAEVWLTLGQAYELQGRPAQARAAMLRALELEKHKPVRSYDAALRRVL